MAGRDFDMRWQLQEAKARFSEVIKLAQTEGAQTVTIHGRDTAVVLSIRDYERLGARHAAFADHLLAAPRISAADAALIAGERSRDLPRDVEI
jgi:prevent-host-death family protein